jgi:hypothetical protein
MPAALAMLDKAWEVRDIQLIWALSDPVFDVLRSEPKFQDICLQISSGPTSSPNLTE